MLSRRHPTLWGIGLALFLAVTVLAAAGLASGVIPGVRRPGAGADTPPPVPTPTDALPVGVATETVSAGAPLLRAQNLEYAPDLDPFGVESFLRSIDSPLADYALVRGSDEMRFPALVEDAARRHAVNPRVLLVLMELATGIVTSPTPEGVMRAAGYPAEAAPDAAAQIERLAETLSAHYVAATMGDAPVAARTPADELVRIDAEDPVRLAIGQTLGETVALAELRAALADGASRFGDVYRYWFGDPLAMPAFALGAGLPADAAWPYEGAKRHTSGPHVGAFCSRQEIGTASGLDFGGEAHEVLVMADGRYLGRGETSAAGLQAGKYALFEHAGGVQVMFWHLGGFSPELLALSPGSEVPRGFPVGWSGRSGNQSAVHLHVELRRGAVPGNPYSGVRVSWDGQVVDGWTVSMYRWPGRSDLGVSYRGSATRGATRLLALANCACDEARAEAQVSLQHPATSAPRNGMDANTVLANYPDVGLLPSSNVRTTELARTLSKTWRARVPWFYFISAAEGVTEVTLDGASAWDGTQCGRALWLSAGEHHFSWRQSGRAGEPAVTIAAWPLAVPGCAAMTGVAPTLDRPPADGYVDAAWTTEGDGGERAVGAPGDVVTVRWRLTNVGTLAWDGGDRVTFHDGYPLEAVEIALPPTAPGGSVTVTLTTTVPARPGEYHATWRLRRGGVAFGPTLPAVVTSLAPGSEAGVVEVGRSDALGAPELVYPTAEGGVAYLNSRDVTLRWTPAPGAEGYDLYLSVLPDPRGDPTPAYHERLSPAIAERRLILAGDVPILYWQVVATSATGEAPSAVGAFGVDTAPPTCALAVQSEGAGGVRVTPECADASSGIATLEVAYRRGEYGDWRSLIVSRGDASAEARLAASSAASYSLRCRGRDRAGNVGAWSTYEATVTVGPSSTAPSVAPAVVSLDATALGDGQVAVAAPLTIAGRTTGVELELWAAVVGEPAPETPAHTWDIGATEASDTLTLTAAIAIPCASVRVGDAMDRDLLLSVRRAGDEATELATARTCVAAPDPYEVSERDGAPGAWLAPGGRHTRGLHDFGDVDAARVAARAGERYAVWTEALGAAADTVISLYDPAGALVAASDDREGVASRLEWTAPTDGVYRVSVQAWAPGSEGCQAGYTLRLQTDPPAPEQVEGSPAVVLPVIGGG